MVVLTIPEKPSISHWQAHVCSNCKRHRPAPGGRTCENCLMVKRRNWQARRDSNMCTKCNARAPEPGGSKCGLCRQVESRRYRKRAAEKVGRHECRSCSRPASRMKGKPGRFYKYCDRHRVRKAADRKKWRARMSPEKRERYRAMDREAKRRQREKAMEPEADLSAEEIERRFQEALASKRTRVAF